MPIFQHEKKQRLESAGNTQLAGGVAVASAFLLAYFAFWYAPVSPNFEQPIGDWDRDEWLPLAIAYLGVTGFFATLVGGAMHFSASRAQVYPPSRTGV